jgi:hypothetical protein
MFLKHVPSDDLVEVIDLPDVINPNTSTIRARAHTGEIIQRTENFLKTELVFPMLGIVSNRGRIPEYWDRRFFLT